MRAVQILLAGFIIVVACACGGLPTVSITSAPPVTTTGANKDKIVGTWEITKPDLLKGQTYEFTKDGKVKVSGGPGPIPIEGTYTVEGDSLKITLAKAPTTTSTIKTLTDKEMTLQSTAGGQTTTTEYKKK